MSPLPERIADRTSFTQAAEFIDNFFAEKVGPDKIWCLCAYEDPFEQAGLCKSLGVDFELPITPIESYTTETAEHGITHHRVYITNQKGVYLELQANKVASFKFPIDLKSVRSIFVRLGQHINEGYVASLHNE